MTIINDTRVVRLQRTAARIGHQHSADERFVEQVNDELVTASDVISLPPGSLITLQRGPGSGHTEEGSVLNAANNDIGGVAGGQTTSVSFDSEDAGATAASVFQTEKDFSATLTTAGDYAVNYKTFQVKTYTPVPTTPGSRILITYAWAPIREYLEWDPEDLDPDLVAFGLGPHRSGGSGDGYDVNVKVSAEDGYTGYLFNKIVAGAGIDIDIVEDDAYGEQLRVSATFDKTDILAGCNIITTEIGDFLDISVNVESLAGIGLVTSTGELGCDTLNVDIDAYQVGFDDSNSPLARGSDVQAAIESIDGYLQDVKGSVIRLNQVGAQAQNAPLNTIYDFGSESYEVGTGRVMVFVNGLFQNRFTDYAELSPTSILFSDALDDDDELDVIIFSGNFAGGQDIESFTLQLAYDNSATKSISLDNGQLSFEQSQISGSSLRLYVSNATNPTTALNIIHDGIGPGITSKILDATNPSLLLQKDSSDRNSSLDMLNIERSTSHILGGLNGIGSSIHTKLENENSILFSASKITTKSSDVSDSAEDTDLVIELSNDGNLQENLTLKSDGKLGVGNSAPTFHLDVAGDVGPSSDDIYSFGSPSLRWKDGYFGADSGINVHSNDSETIESHTWSFDIDTGARDGYFRLLHNGIEYIVVSSNDGYVGIGDPNPNSFLTIGGDISLKETSGVISTPGYGKLYVSDEDGKLYFKNGAGVDIDISTPSFQSSGDITLTVNSTTGSDIPTVTRPSVIIEGDHSGEPFETIQAAVDSLPNILQHAVSITIASGNYVGFGLEGKLSKGASSPGSGQFTIQGTTGTATLTSGSTGGTATSGTSRTITLAGAGWTVDDLQGKFVSITGGTGSGQIILIKSNTTDTLTTVSSMLPVPDGTSVFTIIESKTIINSNGPGLSAILVDKFYGRVDISDIYIDGTTSGIIGVASERIALERCICDNNSYGILLQDMPRSSMEQVGVFGASLDGIRILSVCVAANNEKGVMVKGGTNGFRISGGSTYTLSGLTVLDTTSTAVELEAINLVTISDLEVDNSQIGVKLVNSFLSTSGCDVSNCTTSAFSMTQSGYSAESSLSGTGNVGYGILCNAIGCTVEIANINPTITGSVGDASIDNMNSLSWTDNFPESGRGAVNNYTGARIARS